MWGSGIGLFGSLLNQPLIYENYNLVDYGVIFALTTVVQSIIIYFTNNIITFLRIGNPYLGLVIV